MQYHSVDGPSSADKRTRMSLESEDPELDAAIASSLQASDGPFAPFATQSIVHRALKGSDI